MKPHLRITLFYLLFGIPWIFLSDRWILLSVSENHALTQLQTLKGWIFVLVSALVVYLISKYAYSMEVKRARDMRALYTSTIRATHHIVLNFLNQIQLLKLTAEEHPDFDQSVIDSCEKVTREATEKLHVLARLKDLEASEIERIAFEPPSVPSAPAVSERPGKTAGSDHKAPRREA